MRKVLIVKTNKDPLSDYEFVEPVRAILRKKNILFSEVHIKDIDKSYAERFGRIIVTGTNLQDFDYLKYGKNLNFIKYNQVSVLGICSGMHLIAELFNVPLIDAVEIGVKHLRFRHMKVFLLHKKALDYSKAKEKFFIPACTDKKVKIPQIIIYKNRIFGFQFHPEVFNQDLILKFVSDSGLTSAFSKFNSRSD